MRPEALSPLGGQGGRRAAADAQGWESTPMSFACVAQLRCPGVNSLSSVLLQRFTSFTAREKVYTPELFSEAGGLGSLTETACCVSFELYSNSALVDV